MSDDLLDMLARKAGVDPVWLDQTGREHHVSGDVLRAVLTALSLPCANEAELRNSLSAVELGLPQGPAGRFHTARVGQPTVLPINLPPESPVEIEYENGAVRSCRSLPGLEDALTLPPFEEPGYHTVRVADIEMVVAAAPARCVTAGDLVGETGCWGLSAQIYSLRRENDCGSGDFGCAADLAGAIAARGGDFLALSPVHALFPGEPLHYSPYSPSSRLFYNPLCADATPAFPEELVRSVIADLGIGAEMAAQEANRWIDWRASADLRMRILGALHSHIRSEHSAGTPCRLDFDRFRSQVPPLLRDHAAFEALHSHHLRQGGPWSWQEWAPEFRDPGSKAVATFLSEHQEAFDHSVFLQWIAGRSYAECQRACREAGMRIGVIADMAIGMDGAGSHAWSRQHEVLSGLSIGAPPDFYNPRGQDWGLTGFSPRGLAASGFSPFIETLRAAMRYAGGIRIDHVMGMNRLWLIPRGAEATEGAYLNYPSENLFRLVALESWRHKAIVIGEDLGTLPTGFRGYLQEQGIAGMRVLRFERDREGFHAPGDWDAAAVGMTTTHDLMSTAGWWAGADLPPVEESAGAADSHAVRAWDRGLMWSTFQRAGVASGERPAPENTAPVVDAAIAFVAATPVETMVLAVEDVLGTLDQPNVPGTTTEKPNWRHRLDPAARHMLDGDAAARRLKILDTRGRKPDAVTPPQPPEAAS